MKRREFLKKSALAGVGATAAASGLAAPAIAQGMRELKLVTTWPKNFPGLGTGAQRFADRVTAMTGGKLTVKLYAAGELVPPFESFDAVSSGAADIYHGADYYWQGKNKAFNYFASVPLGMMEHELNAWVYHGGGQQLWDKLGAEFGIKPMLCGNSGVQMGGWYNKEINSLEDVKGLKIRMPGLGGEVMRQAGAAAVNLPGGEIYPALQSGAIDATEWVGPWNDLAFGFYKVTKFYYWPGFHEPGTANGLGINLKVWESFTQEEKDIVSNAAQAENSYMVAEFNANNGAALDQLIKQHGVQLREFPTDVWNEFGKISMDVHATAAGDGGIVKEVVDSYMKFRDAVGGWTKLSAQGYANARSKALGWS